MGILSVRYVKDWKKVFTVIIFVMLKSEFVGAVLLMASGGRPTSDMSIRETDVLSYMAPAINYAMDKADNINRDIEGDRDYLSEFYATFEDVPVDWSGKRPKFVITAKTVPLKGNNGLRFVYDDCGYYYGKLNDADMGMIGHYSGKMQCSRFYRRRGNDVDLYGIGPLQEKINYQVLMSVEDLGPDDELPLQAGTEIDAIKIAYDMATGQLQNIYDPKIDHDDVNKAF